MATDWNGFRLNDLSRHTDVVRQACLESLRTWVDTTSTVRESGGPDDRIYRLVTANDLLHVPSDRRDNCFMGLAQMLDHLERSSDNPEGFVQAMLAAAGLSFGSRRLGSMVRHGREDDIVRKVNTMCWKDDGLDDPSLGGPTQSFTR